MPKRTAISLRKSRKITEEDLMNNERMTKLIFFKLFQVFALLNVFILTFFDSNKYKNSCRKILYRFVKFRYSLIIELRKIRLK